MGTCFLHGNGSGSELNFKVVGGATQPGNPTENTIWVNTDAAITAWLFSASTPTSPVAGMVWITTAATGSVNANLLKKNAVTVCLTSAKQYIGGSWANKAAYIYQGASWVQFSSVQLYLYNMGDECTSVTGGWSAKGTDSGDASPTAPTLTKGSSSIKVSQSGEDYACGACAVNKTIDITPYKTLNINITQKALSSYNTMKNYNKFCVTNTTSSGYGGYVATLMLKDCRIGTNSIDVSSISGKKYIAIFLIADCEMTQSVTFNKVWLE